MNARVVAAYLVQVAVWGTTWAAIKVGVTDVPPWTFAFGRAVIVTAFLGAVALAMRLEFPRGRTLRAAAFSGAINSGVSWSIIFWSEQFVPSGLVAVFGATSPIWTALLAHFLVRRDRMSILKLVALVLGFLGILVLVGASGGITRGPALLAAVLLALMTLGWAVAAVVMSRTLTSVQPIPAIAVGTATGGLFLLPLALFEAASGRTSVWTPAEVGALAYLALVGSGVGLVLNLWLYRRLRPTTIALAQLLITVEAVLVGALVLGEHVTLGMAAGAVLVLTAIVLNARTGGPPSVPAGPVPGSAVGTPAE